MDDILKMAENKVALATVSNAKKKSKYTNKQKVSAAKAMKLADKLNEILKKVVERNETR
jgi:hypothetical protein